jgi:hypothetical protein
MSTSETPAIAPWGKWDRLSLQLILVGAIVYAIAILVAGAVSVGADLVSGERLLTLPVDEMLPAAADDGTATLVDGRFDTARVYVSGLSPMANGLLTAGGIIAILTQLAVAGVMIYLAWSLLRREPFLRSLTWSFVVAGAVLLVGSIVGQSLSGFGAWLTAIELGSTPDARGFWPLSITFDTASLGLGLMLLLVGSAFEYAQKLTVETHGLV